MTALITTHPLEPLSADEIAAAAAILRDARGLTAAHRFVFVALHEPPKADVVGWSGEQVAREAHVVLYERGTRATHEAVVSLTDSAVVSWTLVEGVQPPIMVEEFESCEAVVVADPRWQEAMRRRGVEDFSLAMVDPWASSWTGPQDDPSARRIARPLTWLRAAPGENGYARPVEGLIVVVDLDAGVVVDVTDHGVVPFPTQPGNYEEPWVAQRATCLPTTARAPTSRRSRSPSPRGRASPSTGTRWPGRDGPCGSGSRRVRGWCCTR